MVPTERPLLPQFTVTAIDGSRFDYSSVWQQRNLLLIVLPGVAIGEREKEYVESLTGDRAMLEEYDATAVATTERVGDITTPAVVIADRWGEIYFVRTGASVTDLPRRDEVIEALRWVAHECPECQGEAL